jgi:hypothetical protein
MKEEKENKTIRNTHAQSNINFHIVFVHLLFFVENMIDFCFILENAILIKSSQHVLREILHNIILTCVSNVSYQPQQQNAIFILLASENIFIRFANIFKR